MLQKWLSSAYVAFSSNEGSKKDSTLRSSPCDIYELYNLIQFRCLILDIRPLEEFKRLHIYSSIHLPLDCPSKEPKKEAKNSHKSPVTYPMKRQRHNLSANSKQPIKSSSSPLHPPNLQKRGPSPQNIPTYPRHALF